MNDNLPKWFVLKTPPAIDVEISELKNLGIERIEMLRNFTAIENNLRLYHYKTYSNRYGYDENSSLKGHLFLRLVGANSPKIGSWMIEVEGDLFENLFLKEKNTEFLINIIHFLFKKENFISVWEFKRRFSNVKIPALIDKHPEQYWCFHFSKMPFFVANRKGFLSKGWLIAKSKDFVPTIKKKFEKELALEIDKLKEKIGINDEIDRAIFELEESLQDVQIRRKTGEYKIDFDVELPGDEDMSASETIELFPPCMRFLLYQMEKKGRMTHNLRIQLSLFLKEIGMNLDEQMDFWYRTSVDNVGVSKELFNRRSGYQIRFLFGLEGGRKDYKVPKCATLSTGYFCFFEQLPIATQKAMLMSFYPEKEKNINWKILEDLQYKGMFGQMCSYILSLTLNYKVNLQNSIKHPLSWTRLVDKKKKWKKEFDQKKKEEDEKEIIQNE